MSKLIFPFRLARFRQSLRSFYSVRTASLAIFVKETRAREHICITRGTVHTWEIRSWPPGIRVLSNSSHHYPSASIPRSFFRSLQAEPLAATSYTRAKPSILENTSDPRTNCTSTSLDPHQKRLIWSLGDCSCECNERGLTDDTTVLSTRRRKMVSVCLMQYMD